MYALIIGGGQIGTYMADLLKKNECEFTVIDFNQSHIPNLIKKFGEDHVLFGDASDPNVLATVHIDKADVVACVTGHDETNLVCSMIAKFEFQAPRVIARVNNPNNAWLFNFGMGVDASINQADIIGHLVVEEMSMRSFLTLLKLSKGGHSIVQLVANEGSVAVGKKVSELHLPKSALMIAIYHGEDLIVPNGQTMIYPGDRIMFFASDNLFKELEEIFS